MDRKTLLFEGVHRNIYVCSVLDIRVNTRVSLESAYIKYILKPVVRFCERLNSIISGDDIDTSLIAIERLYAEPLANSQQALFSFCRL